MPSILLLADDPHGARLKSDLEYIGHSVQHLFPEDGDEPLPKSAADISAPVDLIIVDPGTLPETLPQSIQHLRQAYQDRDTPLLTVVDETAALALDFSIGIDDFIVKPYSLREVEARLRLILWNSDRPDDENIIKIGDLVINLIRYEVRVKGSVIELTLKEYELLKHLATRRGRVFTRSNLLDSIWGYDYYGGMRTVDVHIRRLRSKLGNAGDAITTVRGVGYRFDPP